jgi:hypothetical protein
MQNRPNFVTNKLEVRYAYDARTKVVTAPESERSIRVVDMVPAVRQTLLDLRDRRRGSFVFPARTGVSSAVRSSSAHSFARSHAPR